MNDKRSFEHIEMCAGNYASRVEATIRKRNFKG